MDSRVQRFFEEVKGKKVAVIGIGVSHSDLISRLCDRGAKVIACDRRTREQLGEAICNNFEAQGVTLKLGEGYLDGIDAEIVLRTPGMKFHHPVLEQLRQDGVVVTSEMELFFDLCPCKTVAITGSDGKTTTTTIIAEMLKEAGHRVHLGGNIGRPLMPVVQDIRDGDFAVAELSSFQLISMRESPDIAVVTNITPNHLDIHKDMQEYVDAKRNIVLHQHAFSRTVLGVDNELAASFAKDVRGQLFEFSVKHPVRTGAYLEDGVIYVSINGRAQKVLRAEEIKLPGIHNVENYLAAICAVWGYADLEAIQNVAMEFGGVEHRIELVRELGGVKWYNDSIATTPTRTIAGLNSFGQKLIVIAGGYDKKIPFEPLVPKLLEKVKMLILTGATADKIESAVKAAADFDPEKLVVLRAKDLEDAVRIAHEKAAEGDIVSLSPACASFDAYPNFEARGRHFKELVKAL
ncbi:UDP-N-acetylmuramoyl-L-alanine--D-glutamate ligase [Anaerotruncus rubiinfantis]|jgi:UDP-N-acetylmuramoylalanine--D-glutamate ligase|uniref:UDP-N-acetylmuramoyl-L-alanine--D-glutamate ligase n=1 Tax=Anaerotruncus rubiinfantis TaxID=1720200 RepID=UPI00083350E3|nr:UDP-N-acetylmuramoyl-L-alanine--D-glutamate ligase [Anaerotruncus rubiinfantis]